jgi:predicted cupin superfamily sugar epimerase
MRDPDDGKGQLDQGASTLIFMTAEEIKALLHLVPLELEGGYFSETYRAEGIIPHSALPAAYRGPRNYSTAIYFLLTPDTFSAMHRLPSDEVFHFYLGDPVEMFQILPDGSSNTMILGTDLLHGQSPQIVVPGNHWQGARLAEGGEWALLGTTVAPGFDYADYEHGVHAKLIAEFPQHLDMLTALTRRCFP